MGKNKGKGGKNRKRGKNENEASKHELILRVEGQVYGVVLKMLGNNTAEVFCYDGKKRICHIRGKLRKKVWINVGDVVIVSLREFQLHYGDIIFKYTAEDAKQLKAQGELPDTAKVNDGELLNYEVKVDDAIEFAESEESSESLLNIEDI